MFHVISYSENKQNMQLTIPVGQQTYKAIKACVSYFSDVSCASADSLNCSCSKLLILAFHISLGKQDFHQSINKFCQPKTQHINPTRQTYGVTNSIQKVTLHIRSYTSPLFPLSVSEDVLLPALVTHGHANLLFQEAWYRGLLSKTCNQSVCKAGVVDELSLQRSFSSFNQEHL